MKSNNEISIGNGINSTMPSTSRLGGHRADDECSTSAPIPPMMKYRSSISDLGGNNTALDRLTNTRIKSITNRRGAVKYQKYVFD